MSDDVTTAESCEFDLDDTALIVSIKFYRVSLIDNHKSLLFL